MGEGARVGATCDETVNHNDIQRVFRSDELHTYPIDELMHLKPVCPLPILTEKVATNNIYLSPNGL